MDGHMTKSNRDLFVQREEITTVTVLDGSKFIAQESKVTENGKLKHVSKEC